mmetsp:Transcript_29275/g.93614  ORF Transcript_29275/g.93614 Transcript_29275/m.93614 type:complete len:201 (-) Transcript_29275:245-847(-)
MPARRRRRSAPPSTASFGARTLPFSAPAQSTTRSALCLRRTLPSSLASCARWRRLSPRRRARASPSLRSCRIPTFCGVRYGRVGAKRVGGYGPGRRRRPARRVGGYGQSLERPRYNRVRTQYTAAVRIPTQPRTRCRLTAAPAASILSRAFSPRRRLNFGSWTARCPTTPSAPLCAAAALVRLRRASHSSTLRLHRMPSA